MKNILNDRHWKIQNQRWNGNRYFSSEQNEKKSMELIWKILKTKTQSTAFDAMILIPLLALYIVPRFMFRFTRTY